MGWIGIKKCVFRHKEKIEMVVKKEDNEAGKVIEQAKWPK